MSYYLKPKPVHNKPKLLREYELYNLVCSSVALWIGSFCLVFITFGIAGALGIDDKIGDFITFIKVWLKSILLSFCPVLVLWFVNLTPKTYKYVRTNRRIKHEEKEVDDYNSEVLLKKERDETLAFIKGLRK